jgi:hypothetical protein
MNNNEITAKQLNADAQNWIEKLRQAFTNKKQIITNKKKNINPTCLN